MKKPMSNRTPEMRGVIETLFPGTKGAIEHGKCPLCKSDITGFKDVLSERQYEISGMCQKCQDFVFVEERDSDS